MSEVFEIVNPQTRGGVVLLCDHASNHIPPEYDNLGLDEQLLASHIAWDIGAGELARRLSVLVGGAAVLARFSRLLVDTNRRDDEETLMPLVSDENTIPGNAALDDDERKARLMRFYRPFHAACRISLMRAMESSQQPLVLGIHSFTPQMNDGETRPWDVSVMWDRDDRLALAMAKAFEDEGLTVGYNEPYSGETWMHSVKTHADREGLPHAQIEVRQDLLVTPHEHALWALRLVAAIGGARAGGTLD